VRYFEKTPAPDLHHQTYLLWASLALDGLMDKAERKRTVKALLALQREDGGWSLPSLGAWKRLDGSPQDKVAPSDGYATGLVLYVLRQAGVGAAEKPVQRGVAWLKANQRESGRWFTRSLNREGRHYISNTGTAFAILALKACE
jgi:squalene-hopene/tetraprenyl-beta-curcumene cyclase